jgi:hypothetical protein
VLGEHGFGVPPTRRRFPIRNRIIAALSDATVVVEATATGGARITANIAMDYGREVLAMPGSRRNPAAAGCNALIADGAHPLLDPADVLSVIARHCPATAYAVAAARAAATDRSGGSGIPVGAAARRLHAGAPGRNRPPSEAEPPRSASVTSANADIHIRWSSRGVPTMHRRSRQRPIPAVRHCSRALRVVQRGSGTTPGCGGCASPIVTPFAALAPGTRRFTTARRAADQPLQFDVGALTAPEPRVVAGTVTAWDTTPFVRTSRIVAMPGSSSRPS